jgi:small ubiquitin-related modifier
VKPTTKFEKIKKAYADKKHIEASTIRFMFDGTRVSDATNPGEMAMNDGDVIDCMLEQVGGGFYT